MPKAAAAPSSAKRASSCVCVCMCVCVCVCMCARKPACLYVCLCVCLYACMQVHANQPLSPVPQPLPSGNTALFMCLTCAPHNRLFMCLTCEPHNRPLLGWVRDMHAWNVGVAASHANIWNQGPPHTPLISQPPHDHRPDNASMYHYTW